MTGIICTRMSFGTQNGRHETLKADAPRPAKADRRAQQRRFDTFRAEFYDEWPHEALA
jgi:hypothetical protein